MADAKQPSGPDDMLDVHRAAALAGRHPETIRRWVWSGRITARRQGNRLLVTRADVEALAGRHETVAVSLAAWADRARRASAGTKGSGSSSADLVIEDRADRSARVDTRAGR